jgi:AbrB family transcriptional regulator (stage V sporulation protein T)
MKATGIVRRIDDLGRVVIPKEIRRTMRIREGDPLEIFTTKDDEVILKKYSPIGDMRRYADEFAYSINKNTGHTVMITDNDSIISVSGASKKDTIEKPIDDELEEIITAKKTFTYAKGDNFTPVRIIKDDKDADKYSSQLITPILCNIDVIGSVVILSKEIEHFGETEMKIARTAADFLGAQMEQ